MKPLLAGEVMKPCSVPQVFPCRERLQGKRTPRISAPFAASGARGIPPFFNGLDSRKQNKKQSCLFLISIVAPCDKLGIKGSRRRSPNTVGRPRRMHRAHWHAGCQARRMHGMKHDQDGTGWKNRDAAKPVRHTGNNRKWGFTDQELAARPTVFREGLMTGKTVLISGGGTGMGKAMAFLFARLGGNVIICGRREELLAETSASIERFTGRKVAYKSMSIREENDVDALIDECFDRHGGIDILINNAGGQFPQDAVGFTRKGWRAVIDLNLSGTWYMMQTTAQHWRDRNRGGSIINIVANVERGMPQAAHTCAARAGVIYLS